MIQQLCCLLFVLFFVALASHPNLRSTNIDDLDSAHHILDGYFFYDLIRDLPHSGLAAYVVNYHKQYPALGFLFWPPLVPAVAGLLCFLLGPHVFTARVTILLFGAIFGISFYEILRREVGSLMAAAATAAAISVPGVFWSFNEVMLELPTLAVMCVAVLAVRYMMDRANAPTSYFRGVLVGAICAAVIYTKQPAWFLYPALAIVVLRNATMRKKLETYVALAACVFFCIPLALFTLKFGHANLAQSVGSNTQLIMPTYKSDPRWSLAAWSFYPRVAPSLLNAVIVLLGLGGLVLCVRKRFRDAHLLWLCWFVLFYVTFSFYDNRLSRHATFWCPAWIALAAAFLSWVGKRMDPRAANFLPLVLLVPAALQLPADLRQDYSDFHDERPIVAGLYAGRDPGNVLLFGPDKQTFIVLIREFDVHRRDTAVRGERLLADGTALNQVCQSYRTREVLVELTTGDSIQKHPEFAQLESSPEFVREADTTYMRRGKPMEVLVFHYTGPIDAKMADIPLSDKLL